MTSRYRHPYRHTWADGLIHVNIEMVAAAVNTTISLLNDWNNRMAELVKASRISDEHKPSGCPKLADHP